MISRAFKAISPLCPQERASLSRHPDSHGRRLNSALLPSRPGWEFGSSNSRRTLVYQTISDGYKQVATAFSEIARIRKKFSRKRFRRQDIAPWRTSLLLQINVRNQSHFDPVIHSVFRGGRKSRSEVRPALANPHHTPLSAIADARIATLSTGQNHRPVKTLQNSRGAIMFARPVWRFSTETATRQSGASRWKPESAERPRRSPRAKPFASRLRSVSSRRARQAGGTRFRKPTLASQSLTGGSAFCAISGAAGARRPVFAPPVALRHRR
jgi:hypothetical protein